MLVNGRQLVAIGHSVAPQFERFASVCAIVIPTLFVCWVGAKFVMALGVRSKLLALCGAIVFVAVINYLSWAMW